MEPIIEFENFTFKYRSQMEPTLRDINLKIYPGEKVLIIGPSGSGKSTLSNCINGLIPFSYEGDRTGTLKIEGKDPKKLGIFGLSKMVGTVLQDTDGQFIGLTVAEDIAFVLENDCMAQEEMFRKVDDVAETVEVKELLHHAPSEMSGGQKQRVSMAGVMIDDVDILLFDEPLANLDPATGKYAMELIDEIQQQTGAAVVIIEHRLEDVLHRDVDRIVLMAEGRILADCAPDELLCSDLLEKNGIREPLYLTALKYAGVRLTPEMNPHSLRTLTLTEADKAKVRIWQRGQNQVAGAVRPPLLTADAITFTYPNGFTAVKDLTVSIREGELTAIVGTNGAGKTSFSKVICGFERQQKGTLRFADESLDTLSIKERADKIGYVMQNPNQMISKTMIFDEVALGLRTRGVAEGEIKPRVEDTLKVCGLWPFRSWPVSALSYGQKKRVTIASILVLEPKLIILDEPTAGQDYRHYTEIMQFLEQLKKRGITVLMITHDMHLMLEYAERALVFHDGRLIADDSSAAILTNPEIVKTANLKETSLYDLALLCGIEDGQAFVQRFIDFERGRRAE